MLYLVAKVLKILTAPAMMTAAVAGCLLIILASGTPVCAEAAPHRKLERLKENYGETQRKMTESREEIRVFTEKERNVLDDLNDIDRSIDLTRKKIAASEKELRNLEDRITSVQTESGIVEEAVQAHEIHADRRMISLYKLGNIGRMRVLAAADSLTDFLRRRKALERILESDRMVLEEYGRRTAALAALNAELDERKRQRADVEEDLRRQLGEMKTERNRREELLADIRGRKALRKAALASLEQRAAALDRKIQSFRRETSALQKSSEETAGGFSRLKGLLKMPVKGTVTATFGPNRNKEYGVVNFQSGIDIQADRGEPIHAVYGGRVIFSSWFKGYGNMVIIDHEDHYYTLYAHAEELFKQKGEIVQADEVIGTVGDSGAMTGSSLHFEVRHHGKPVDPLTWVKN